MEGDASRVAGPLTERKRWGGRESGRWKRNDTRGDESLVSVAAGDDGFHNGGESMKVEGKREIQSRGVARRPLR
jgi:hypothetical protein